MSKATTAADRQTLDAQASAQSYGWKGRVVLTPAGPCPVKLDGTDAHTVQEWAEKVVHSGHLKANAHYGPSALRYFAREFYDIFSPEYGEVCEHINALTPSYVADVSEEHYEAPRRPTYTPAPSKSDETPIVTRKSEKAESPIVTREAEPTEDDEMMSFEPTVQPVGIKRKVAKLAQEIKPDDGIELQ